MIRSSEPCFRKTFPTQTNKNAELGVYRGQYWHPSNRHTAWDDALGRREGGSPASSELVPTFQSPAHSSSSPTDQQVPKCEDTPATVMPANAVPSTNGATGKNQYIQGQGRLLTCSGTWVQAPGEITIKLHDTHDSIERWHKEQHVKISKNSNEYKLTKTSRTQSNKTIFPHITWYLCNTVPQDSQ